jgi:uncharacterized membrane protein YgcG
VRGCLIVGVVGLAGVMTAGPAAAVPWSVDSTERITDMSVVYELRTDGSMHVTEKITYDFGKVRDRHGFERFVPERFEYDSEHYRIYPISGVRAQSPSGAPDAVEELEPDVTVRIGDKDEVVTGEHVYVLDYDVRGVVNATADAHELYWNVVGDQWKIPIQRVKVTVSGPGAAVQQATCYQGLQGSTEPCTWSMDKGMASFEATRALQPRESLTIVAGFPAGTFTETAPILSEKWSFSRAFGASRISAGASLAVFAVLVGGTGILAWRRGRDRQYAGVTPGLVPGAGEKARITPVSWRRPPVAVRFTPPEEVRVGEVGMLADERVDVKDVTATIIDLAVRGYLRIEEAEDDPQDDDVEDGESGDDGADQDDRTSGDATSSEKDVDDWVLVKLDKPLDDLREYEDELLRSLFEDQRRVRLSVLRTTFATDLRAVQTMIYKEATGRGWFRGNPQSVRNTWWAYGWSVTVVGFVAVVMLALATHLALIGVALTLSGLIMVILAGKMPSRSATGTALLAQIDGFRLYLETAEANQIRFEEGQDIFSRYLPYAIVFGVAERWANVFADLAAAGRSLPEPSWYGGDGPVWGPGSFDYHRFGVTMRAFSDETTSSIAAVAAPTPSSSGSSGFDGGFSGGGGGGGGGGSW